MPDFAQALQPIAGNSKEHNHNASTKILRDLAPQLFHPRIANSNAFISGGQGSSSSSSGSSSNGRKRIEARQFTDLSNPNNAWITLARTLNLNPTNKGKEPVKPQAVTSVDLRIIEGVDRLLGLPLPLLESVQEEDEDNENENEDSAKHLQVGLMEGFNATIPSASYRKTARRRKRADISERQLGIQAGVNELGLKERGDRARGLLSAEWQIDSIEGTPRRRTIRTKRRSSFMPGQPSDPIHTDEEAVEELTKPELEAEITEIRLDKQALSVRRKLVLTDLEELEERIRKLEDVREELGSKLLQLKEEELELDDELEGAKDRLTALDARTSGKAVQGTSSRRRRGPAFLPSEHDDLPPNIAFMTLTPSTSLPNSASSFSSHFQHPYDQQPPSSITSLDFSEPYGTLVASYSEPDKGVRVYDLSTGIQASELKGHRGIVKSLLVEGNLCITGGQDGKIVLWDLPIAIEEGIEQERIADGKQAYIGKPGGTNNNNAFENEEDPFFTPPKRKASPLPKDDLPAEGGDEDEEANDMLTEIGDGFSRSKIRFLEGHSKDVTCLSYEDSSLVSGSSDKTLRLWDLHTGQCVVTMDILWAISNPLPVEVEDMQPAPAAVSATEPSGNRRHTMAASVPLLTSPGLPGSPSRGYDGDYPWSASSSSSYMTPNRKRTSLSGLRRLSSQYGNLSSLASPSTPTAQLSSFSFAQATPPYSDGSWEMYSDFVGGLQLWSYALASGSADGCVRMWDTRTGQNVRSLIGHTGAITSLQFDNFHLMSGSLDKSLRIWDLRTGKTSETIKYDGPVTDLQFDSRRILVAGGTNSIQVFNRTTLQQTELIVNGHTSPVEKLRFMDKYLATGGRDSTVKIWSLA